MSDLHPKRLFLLACLLLAPPWSVQAAPPDMRPAAQAWLARQVEQAHPDSVSRVEIAPLDSRLRLGACNQYQFFLPPGARLWSGGSLGVKCVTPSKWTLYLNYQVQLTGPGLVAARPLPARHLLEPSDVALANVRYEFDPGGYLREIPHGATTQRPLNANHPVLIHDLVLPDVIRAGSRVRVRVHGQGFSVAQEGKALNAAKAGAPVQVKMPNGRIVRGMANQAGDVEIRP
jgi:flagella basal body P-ring formation protein FlgA